MNDAAILINGYAPDANRTHAPTNQRPSAQPQSPVGGTRGSNTATASVDHAPVPVGPFEHLLREIQRSTQPRASRLNECGASEMFEPRPGATDSSRAEPTNDADRSNDPEANESKTPPEDLFNENARRSRDGEPSERSLHQASDARISAKPSGQSFNRSQESPAPNSPNVAVAAPPASKVESGTHASDGSSPLRIQASSAPSRAPTPPPPSNVASASPNASPLRETSTAQQATSTSGAIGTNDGPRSASIADKLAPVLAELVRDGAKSPRRAAGSFQDALTKTLEQQDRTNLRTPSDTASGSPQPTPEADSDRTVQPSPFDAFIRSIRMHGGESRSSARIRLNPPELGAMTVYVRVNGDRIRVDVRTETADAARRLQSHAADLRIALQQQGLSVDAVAIESVDRIAAGFVETGSAVLSLPSTAKGRHDDSAVPSLPSRERGRGEGSTKTREGFFGWS